LLQLDEHLSDASASFQKIRHFHPMGGTCPQCPPFGYASDWGLGRSGKPTLWVGLGSKLHGELNLLGIGWGMLVPAWVN